MSVGTKEVKITAKTALKGNMVSAIAACSILVFSTLIIMCAAELLSEISIEFSQIFSVFSMILLISPLFLGVLRYIWRLLFSQKDNPVSVFYWFSEGKLYIKAMEFTVTFVFKALVRFLISDIPSLIFRLLANGEVLAFLKLGNPALSVNFAYISGYLKIAAIIFTFLMMLKYYMAPVLFVANEEKGYSEAFRISNVISRKSTMDFIYLCFSFWLFVLVSVFVMPLIFTLPYMLTAYAVHVRFSVADYNIYVRSFMTPQTPF